MLATFREHTCLMQGPPSTGKSTTAGAILYVNQAVLKRVLACAPSNEAVDVFTVQCATLGMSVVRDGRSVGVVSRQIVAPLCLELATEEAMKQDGWLIPNT